MFFSVTILHVRSGMPCRRAGWVECEQRERLRRLATAAAALLLVCVGCTTLVGNSRVEVWKELGGRAELAEQKSSGGERRDFHRGSGDPSEVAANIIAGAEIMNRKVCLG